LTKIADLTLGIGGRRSKACVHRFPIVLGAYPASVGFTQFFVDDAPSLYHKRLALSFTGDSSTSELELPDSYLP